MRAFYREKKYICGDYMDVQIFPVYAKAGVRRSKAKPTSETQARLNDENSKKQLTRLLHTNFTSKDLALHLTYDDEHLPDNEDTAKKDVQRFLRKLRVLYKKSGSELKYVWVCEKGEKRGRVHHHIILNSGVDRDVIESLWQKGFANSKRLRFTETGIAGLSHYVTKQALFFKHWCASKNLKRPIEKTSDYNVSAKQAAEMVKYSDSSTIFEKKYPGYFYSQCTAKGNEINGGLYIFLQMYSANSRWRN